MPSAFKMYHIQLPEFRKKYKSFESVKGGISGRTVSAILIRADDNQEFVRAGTFL